MITLVSVDRVDAVWPHVRVALELACLRTGGGLSTVDLWRGCRSGEYFLGVVHDADVFKAVAVGALENWATGRRLRIRALAGSGMKEWLPEFMEYGRKFARENGAKAVVFDGRKGWERALKAMNAKVLRVVYEVEA